MLKKIVNAEATTNKIRLPKIYTDKYGKKLVLEIVDNKIILTPEKSESKNDRND